MILLAEADTLYNTLSIPATKKLMERAHQVFGDARYEGLAGIRPCFFPDTVTDAEGKEYKRYRYEEMKTPYEKFKSLPNAKDYLKPDITFDQLNVQAAKMSDNDAALALNNAKKKLFRGVAASIKKQA